MSGDEWAEKTDSEYWFEITDGKNSIVIDHFGYGEDLPDVRMAAEEYEGVYQAFISTKNEVFIVTGLADSREHLEDVMQTIGTIRILKYDAKTAVQKETQAVPAAQTRADSPARVITAARSSASAAVNGSSRTN